MSKRRRTSSDIDSEESDDSEQYPVTPAIRKKKKLDPVDLYEIIIFVVITHLTLFRPNNVNLFTSRFATLKRRTELHCAIFS